MYATNHYIELVMAVKQVAEQRKKHKPSNCGFSDDRGIYCGAIYLLQRPLKGKFAINNNLTGFPRGADPEATWALRVVAFVVFRRSVLGVLDVAGLALVRSSYY